jgi:O-antigen ligase
MKHKQELFFDWLLKVGPIYALVMLLFIVPMLIPYSYYPVSKFSSEVLAGIFGSAIGFCVVLKNKRIEIPSIAIAAVLFGIFLLLQPLLIPIRLPGINMVVACWFWAASMMSIGVATFINRDNVVQQQLVTVVCSAIFVSAFIQAVYGLLQYTGLAANLGGLVLYIDNQATNVFGNIGQKNDYVDFITMGVFALSYLYFIRKIKLFTYVIYELFFIIIISMTTSRTSFVYFIFALIVTLLFIISKGKHATNKADNRRILMMVGGLFLGLLLTEAVFPIIMKVFFARTDATSGLYRFQEASVGQSTYRRFYEWYKCIVIFLNHPWFGIGWYQYPREAIELMLKDSRFWYIPANSALYTHSHNSVANIMAETGIIGTFIIIGYGIIYTIYNMLKNFNNYETLFIVFIVLTLIGQSLFQYPLWYGYFFMYFMFLLSINKGTISFNNSKFFSGMFAVIFFGFVYLCGVNYQTYTQVAELTHQPRTIDEYTNNVTGLIQVVNDNPLWQLPALIALDGYLQPGSAQTSSVLSNADMQKYIDMIGNQLPYPGALFKQLVIRKINGDSTGAAYYANLLAHGFPYFKDKFADQLEQMGANFVPEAQIIRNFHYEDKSIFANKIFKGSTQKEG